ncbi:MAG: c-type cytochrome [Ferruginibacter sp.]
MKITFTVILGCVALIMMSFLISNDEPPTYKNLKVLPKNITKDQMDSVMHHFADAMGKKCNFCHVYNEADKKMDFVSDAKEEKGSAREMWKMSVKLNKKYFDIKDSKSLDAKLAVTCFTCHHGSPHPETKPPMRMDPPRNRPAGPPLVTDSTKH